MYQWKGAKHTARLAYYLTTRRRLPKSDRCCETAVVNVSRALVIFTKQILRQPYKNGMTYGVRLSHDPPRPRISTLTWLGMEMQACANNARLDVTTPELLISCAITFFSCY